MIAIIPKENISTQDLKILRQISNLSFAEIKQAAVDRKPVRTFEEFGSNWETDKIILAKMAQNYTQNPGLPYQFAITEDSEIDEFLNAETLNIKLKYLRAIELETQKNSDLENGYIANRAEFEPHDDDWTIVE